ncbi:hypothetical protein GA0115261_110101, partial [Streptomyces sp. OspMP-M43]
RASFSGPVAPSHGAAQATRALDGPLARPDECRRAA